MDTLVTEVLGDFDNEIREVADEAVEETEEAIERIWISDEDRKAFAREISEIVKEDVRAVMHTFMHTHPKEATKPVDDIVREQFREAIQSRFGGRK